MSKNPKIPNNPKHSRPGYEYLTCYTLGLVIQELTEEFTQRWVKSPRRKWQMDEASRSNPQNIAEGYTQESLKGYIYLSGIAHGSNEELGNDYVRFLNVNKLTIWPKSNSKTFCNMEGYLLKKLVESLKEKHKTQGGLTEKLYQKRREHRGY